MITACPAHFFECMKLLFVFELELPYMNTAAVDSSCCKIGLFLCTGRPGGKFGVQCSCSKNHSFSGKMVR
eukprot:m.1665897 g.1665897  ORF g.1665897 m.1665897 type:complete len:70 (-) comp143293_c0_seq1:39-248(-)